MGFIIIGVILAATFIFVSFRRDWCFNVVSVFVALIIGCGLLAPLFVPGTPIERELVKKVYIASLSDDKSVYGSKGLFYVRVNTDNSYSYYYEVDNDFMQSESEKSYKHGTLKEYEVIIVEYENDTGEMPALYEFKVGTKANFWSYGFIEHEYIFRVPKGTVVQQFELNGR